MLGSRYMAWQKIVATNSKVVPWIKRGRGGQPEERSCAYTWQWTRAIRLLSIGRRRASGTHLAVVSRGTDTLQGDRQET